MAEAGELSRDVLAKYVKLQLSLVPLFSRAPVDAIARLAERTDLLKLNKGHLLLDQVRSFPACVQVGMLRSDAGVVGRLRILSVMVWFAQPASRPCYSHRRVVRCVLDAGRAGLRIVPATEWVSSNL